MGHKSETGASGRGTLGYLCLEAAREGQASHAHVHKIVDGLREIGWEVDLLLPRYTDCEEEPGVGRRLKEFVRLQAMFIRRMRDWDAVYVRGHFAAFPTAACARLLDVPMLREVNGTYQDLFIAWPQTRTIAPLVRWGTHLQMRWSDRVLAVTPGLGQWAGELVGSESVFIVPNAADIDLFHPDARSEYGLPSRYVLFFGTFAPWQGIRTLLSAVRDPSWPESVSLVMAGDGALRKDVERASGHERITYLARIPYEDVPGVVAGSLAALSPQGHGQGRSKNGLFPVKVFETMACGVPIVVTDHPGQADLVRSEECGLVIPPEDPMSLARAVRQLVEDPDAAKAMGRRGRRAAEQRHSWRQRAAQTDSILTDLLDKLPG